MASSAGSGGSSPCSAANAAAVNYLVPVAAVLVSLITLGEPITWNMIVGTTVVLAGFAHAENRLARRRRPASPVPAEHPVGPPTTS